MSVVSLGIGRKPEIVAAALGALEDADIVPQLVTTTAGGRPSWWRRPRWTTRCGCCTGSSSRVATETSLPLQSAADAA